jgi:hypothetical protein
MFLTNRLFLVIGIPAIVAAIDILTKLAIRRPRPGGGSMLTREDYVWAFDWTLAAIVAVMTFLAEKATRLVELGNKATTDQWKNLAFDSFDALLLLLAITFIGIFGTSLFINRLGYEDEEDVTEPESPLVQAPDQPGGSEVLVHNEGREEGSRSLRWGRGVVLPNLAGMLWLIAAFAFGTQG